MKMVYVSVMCKKREQARHFRLFSLCSSYLDNYANSVAAILRLREILALNILLKKKNQKAFINSDTEPILIIV